MSYNEKSFNKLYIKLQGLENIVKSWCEDEEIDHDNIYVVMVEVIKVLQEVIRNIHIKT